MIEVICENYGEPVEININGETRVFYNFPKLEQMYADRKNMEQMLRDKKLGFRAKWISGAVEKLHSLGGRQWMDDLVGKPYKEAHKALVDNFTGVGQKASY
jgi:hypothetical protein